eukprot:7602094-Lingulodinium_polyedra.AAC.1
MYCMDCAGTSEDEGGWAPLTAPYIASMLDRLGVDTCTPGASSSLLTSYTSMGLGGSDGSATASLPTDVCEAPGQVEPDLRLFSARCTFCTPMALHRRSKPPVVFLPVRTFGCARRAREMLFLTIEANAAAAPSGMSTITLCSALVST